MIQKSSSQRTQTRKEGKSSGRTHIAHAYLMYLAVSTCISHTLSHTTHTTPDMQTQTSHIPCRYAHLASSWFGTLRQVSTCERLGTSRGWNDTKPCMVFIGNVTRIRMLSIPQPSAAKGPAEPTESLGLLRLGKPCSAKLL